MHIFDLVVGFPSAKVAHVHTGVGYARHVPLPATPHLVTFVTRQLTVMPRSLADDAVSVLRNVVAAQLDVSSTIAALEEGFGCRVACTLDCEIAITRQPPTPGYPRSFAGRVLTIPGEGWVGIDIHGSGFGIVSRKAAPYTYRSIGVMCAAALSHAAQDLLFAERVKGFVEATTRAGGEFHSRANNGDSFKDSLRLPAYKNLGGRLGVEAVVRAIDAIVGCWDTGMLTIASQASVNAAIRELIDPFIERVCAIGEPARSDAR